VAQKYDPIREAIAVKQANLQRLIDSPRTSIQDKNRAQKQLDIQNALDKKNTEEKAEQKAIWDIATQGAELGINAKDLKAIQNAKTKEEALALIGEQVTRKDLEAKGYNYVATPAERDALIAQGYETIESGGRTYAKEPETTDATTQSYVDQINAGKIKLTNVPASLRNDVALALSTSTTTSTGGGGGETTTVVLTPEEKAFSKDLESERKKLQRGGDWGKSWNFLHNRYPEATNEQIDAMLDKNKYFKN